MVQPGVVQWQQMLLSRAAGDEQGTGGECGDAGEPLPSADPVIAGPFGKWLLHETGSDLLHHTIADHLFPD
jgi:hypothetical protein